MLPRLPTKLWEHFLLAIISAKSAKVIDYFTKACYNYVDFEKGSYDMTKKWKCDKQSLHTHTVYSDGTNTPEEMVLAAIKNGFDAIGFSEHSYIEQVPGHWLTPEQIPAYVAELDMLKEKYADKIKVFKGIEYDSYSTFSTDAFDYVIGNVHYCRIKDGRYMPYCSKFDIGTEIVKNYYGGDVCAYAKDYYERFLDSLQGRKIDIVGHFDTLTKFQKRFGLIEGFETKQYRDIALEAIRAAKDKCDLFEINVGNVHRKISQYPNPAPFLIKELKDLGARVLVTLDAHTPEALEFCLDSTYELLLECGFETVWVLTEQGFKEQRII